MDISQTKIHVLWAALILILAVWFSWFYRYEQLSPGMLMTFQDRWTGEIIVYADDPDRATRYTLGSIVKKGSAEDFLKQE